MNFQSLIERKLEPKGVSGNSIVYACPRCEEPYSGHHLSVDYDKEKFRCFKCGFKGRKLTPILKVLGIDVNFDYDSLESDQDLLLDEIINPPAVKVDFPIVNYSKDLSILQEYYCHHIQDLSDVALGYLLSRGMSPEMISYLRIVEGVSRYGETFNIKGVEIAGRDYSNRIIIPSLKKDGSVTFYLGRDYTGMKSNKYNNAPKEIAVASEDVWNLDLIDSDYVIINEGVFTAIAVNEAFGKIVACATYGKSIASKSSESDLRVRSQGDKLLEKNFKSYIMFYDKDALEESYANAKYLHDRGANVRIVVIPDSMYGPKADAADMHKSEILELIRNSLEYDEFNYIKSSLTLS